MVMRIAVAVLVVWLVPAAAGAQNTLPVSALPADVQVLGHEPDGVPPVSYDRIRKALALPGFEPLRELDEKPVFRVEVRERQRLDDLLATLDYRSGPTPASGVYALEQQRQLFNPVQHPMAQPYAAFSTPELVTVLVEEFFQKLFGPRLANTVAQTARSRDEAAARAEVDRAWTEYLNGIKPH